MRSGNLALRKSIPFWIQQLIFWVVSIFVFTSVLIFTRGDFNFASLDLSMAGNILMTVGFLAITVYINLLWLIPAFFNKRRFFLFSVLELGNILLFIFLNYFVTWIVEEGPHPSFMMEFIAEFILVVMFLTVSTLLQVMRDSITLQDVKLRIAGMERQKIESELRVLKAQVNPHFFFNTLNSLYSLSLDKSDQTPEMILKLSDLMRFVIYESNEDMVPIGKQLDFLKSFVSLEQLRSDESLRIEFQVTGNHYDLRVAPLLYIAFIENAFKHGSRIKSDDPFIRIFFDLSHNDRIGFLIENRLDPFRDSPKGGGFGLPNVKKRLELLYPERHILKIGEEGTVFRVELTIYTT